MKRTMPLLTVLTLSLISSPAQSAPTLLQKAKTTAAKTVKVGSHGIELAAGIALLMFDLKLLASNAALRKSIASKDIQTIGFWSGLATLGITFTANGYTGLKRELAPKSSSLQTVKKLFARLMHKTKETVKK